MQMDKFTVKSQEALQEAQRIAHGFSHQEVDGEHLLLAMLQQEDSLIPQLLEKLGALLAKGIITQADFDAKKAELLKRIK